ncbi:MAG: class I SAM-dependent methyltransferase [Actinomycetia bacterium]|nr:class I SAM-dependent methyltransferase [Actinomycetes bacterium]
MEARIRALAGLLAPYRRVADIGAGSGVLARWLLERGHRVVATDVSPHAVAALAAALPGAAVRLGDGLTPVGRDEVDAAVLAGLGGRTIARVLRRDAARAAGWTVVLQPMDTLAPVVAALRELDRGVAGGTLVASGGRLYAILVAPPGLAWNGPDDRRWDALGAWLIDDPLWPAWVDAHIARAAARHATVRPTSGRAMTARRALAAEIAWLKERRHVET